MAGDKHKFNESVENQLGKILIDSEYSKGKSAKDLEINDFEVILDKFECKHTEKDYEWMSDIEYPFLASIILTDASGWANQYFQNRDFVEVKLEGLSSVDKKKCATAKSCINQTLNNRPIHHYSKYIRGRTINALHGQIYALCWWEKKVSNSISHYENRVEDGGMDELGNPITRTILEPVYKKNIKVDRFNYDVIDPRNIITDGRYVYSPQDKDWFDIRSESTFNSLKEKETERGYFNLDIAKKLYEGTYQETETARETYAHGEENKDSSDKVAPYLDRITRFGKIWAIIKRRDEEGNPVEIEPGYDDFGNVKEKAELIESIIEFVIRGTNKVLIRFQPTPFIDTNGNPYKPIVRGLCYIHPTKDIGLSSGRYMREIQTAISDHFNMGSDRVKLATLPTLKGNRNALLDNTTIYFAPEHVMELDNPKEDLEEFKIQDNIQGTLQMISMLENSGQRTEAIYPTTMGQLPEEASTTATAVAGAETRTSSRANYKSLTFEYTFLLDFYWMILQMTWAFAEPETAIKMMGQDAIFFDPDAEYTYSPVSSNIEMEYNKFRKLQIIDQAIGRLVNVPNPKIWKILNRLLAMQFEYLGKEYQEFANDLLEENAPPPEGGMGTGQGQVPNLSYTPTTNQTGTPQSLQEQYVRGV